MKNLKERQHELRKRDLVVGGGRRFLDDVGNPKMSWRWVCCVFLDMHRIEFARRLRKKNFRRRKKMARERMREKRDNGSREMSHESHIPGSMHDVHLLLWHPVSLIVFVILMAAWLFLYFLRDEPLVIANREINDWVVLVVLFGVTIILLLFTGVKENVLVSVLIGLVFVVVHGVVRRTDDLCLDEAGGYLVASSS
ncbi:PRA1 family protein F3-like protein [Tanacetum coccineum]